MSDSENLSKESPTPDTAPGVPLVFVSHDSRDAELAEAFSALLRSVTSGMLKTFRSSDKTGTEGIEYGDEWYKRLMSNLESASHVVCLFTQRSLDRPWILYEAGVAKGKLGTTLLGIALGVPLNRINTGPFYQFQNCDDSEDGLRKLVLQLARTIPGLDPDDEVVASQVTKFKTSVDKILKKMVEKKDSKEKQTHEEASMARLFEEMKGLLRDLPSRVTEQVSESSNLFRRRPLRRLDAFMLKDVLHMAGGPDDPTSILVAGSLVRDEVPWLYEMASDVYRTIKSGDKTSAREEQLKCQRMADFLMHSSFSDKFTSGSREIEAFCVEFLKFLEYTIPRHLKRQRASARPHRQRPANEQ